MLNVTVPDLLETARQHHLAGRPADAESLYRQILSDQSHNAVALMLLGVALADQGKLAPAVASYHSALELKPDFPEAHYNLALVLAKLGRTQEAIASFARAIELRPAYARAHNELGSLLAQAGRFEDARLCYTRAIASHPQFAEAHYNLAVTLAMLRQRNEAIAAYRQALALQPNFPSALNNLAALLATTGQLDAAIECYRRCLALNPAQASTHLNLGIILLKQRHFTEAAVAFETAFKLDPNLHAAAHGMAAVKYEHAILTGDRSITTVPPQVVAASFNLIAPHFDAHLVGNLQYRGPQYLRDAIAALAPDRKFDILDLGCGTGLCGLELRPFASRLTGIDLAPAMIEQARARNVYDELHAADLRSALQQHRDHYDLIVAGDVFVYVGDLEETFADAHTALRPTGLFAFTLERSDQPTFTLLPTGRFTHSLEYITTLAARHNFALLHAEEKPLRTESQQPIPAWIIVLRKIPS